MERWFLVSNNDNSIIDSCLADSKEQAHNYLIGLKRPVGDFDVLSEADYLAELQLNQLESQ